METKKDKKQQENYIARGYKREVIEVIEKRVGDSDRMLLQQTQSITKRFIIKREE